MRNLAELFAIRGPDIRGIVELKKLITEMNMKSEGTVWNNAICVDCGHVADHHNFRYNDEGGIQSNPCGEDDCQCAGLVTMSDSFTANKRRQVREKIAAALQENLDQAGLSVDKELPDMVNHPPHYHTKGPEVIEMVRWLSFNRGNAVKYIARAGKKDPEKEAEDLEKAIWYLTDELKIIRGEVQ